MELLTAFKAQFIDHGLKDERAGQTIWKVLQLK